MKTAIALLVVSLVTGCKKQREEAKPPPPAPVAKAIPPEPAPPPVTEPVDSGSHSAPTDAGTTSGSGSGSGSASEPPTLAVETRLLGYAMLLAYDLSIESFLERFPGAPATTTFAAGTYGWHGTYVIELPQMKPEIDAILQSTEATPAISADAPVRDYAEILAREIAMLISLHAYYSEKAFIDDEFDRGRREAPEVKRVMTALGEKRAAMRAAIYAAWPPYAGQPDSPRAMFTTSWRACMLVAERLDSAADLADDVSACRRSIQPIAGLPEAVRGKFPAVMRALAVVLGDSIAGDKPAWWQLEGVVRDATFLYYTMWPKLAASPAERPEPPESVPGGSTAP